MLKKFIAAWIASALSTNLLFFFICQVWFRWVYFVPPLDGFRTEMLEGKWGRLFSMGIMNFIITLLLVTGYHSAYKHIPYTGIKKGVSFGFFVWFTGGLFYLLHTVMSFRMSAVLFFFWMLIGLLDCVLVGVVASVIYK